MIQVHIDTEALKRAFSKESLKYIDKAAVRATNRTLASLASKTKKEIAGFLNVPQKYVAKRILTVKATAARPYARLRVGDVGINLAQFNPKIVYIQTRRGRRRAVQITIDGQTQIVPGGFLAAGANGNQFIFARTGDGRYPIAPQYSQPLSRLFNSEGYLSTLDDFTRETFLKNFYADLEYFAKQAGA